jgi:hypothetical protein
MDFMMRDLVNLFEECFIRKRSNPQLREGLGYPESTIVCLFSSRRLSETRRVVSSI